MTDKRINKLKRKLQEARYRLLTREPELAAPLVEMLFVTNVDVRRMSTNGSCIYFDASWLEKLDDNSLDFALCHQLMHIRLGHLSRPQFYKGDRFHFACNIVVNSSLIRYDFTDDKLPGIGEIHHETFYPKVEGCELTPYEAFQMTPLDPSTLSDAQRRNLLLDSDEWWDRPNARTEDGVLILSPDDPDPDDLLHRPGRVHRACAAGRGIQHVVDRRRDLGFGRAACHVAEPGARIQPRRRPKLRYVKCPQSPIPASACS